MRKTKLLVTALLFLLLSFGLAACGTNDAAKPYVDAGDKAMKEKKYTDAMQAYANAYKQDNQDKVLAKLQDARKQRATQLKDLFQKAYSEPNYKQAQVYATELKKFKDQLDENYLKTYNKQKKEVSTYLKEQEEFDTYLTWAKATISEVKEVENQWSVISTNIRFGDPASADSQLQTLILKNMDIKKKVDTKSFEVPKYAESHKLLIDITKNNNKALEKVLEALREDKLVSGDIVDQGKDVDETSNAILQYTSSLNAYASSHKLAYTFNDIAVPTEEQK